MSSLKRNHKTQILEAYLRLFTRRGYHGVGLEEVAREAGVSRQAVYLHFHSKAGLLVAAMRYTDQKVEVPETLQHLLENGSAMETIDSLTEAYAIIEPQIYAVASVLFLLRHEDPAAEAAWQDRMAFRRENSKKLVQKLKRENLLAKEWTVDAAADFVTALFSLRTYEYLVLERGWTIKRFVKHLRQIMHKSLVRRQDDGT